MTKVQHFCVCVGINVFILTSHFFIFYKHFYKLFKAQMSRRNWLPSESSTFSNDLNIHIFLSLFSLFSLFTHFQFTFLMMGKDPGQVKKKGRKEKLGRNSCRSSNANTDLHHGASPCDHTSTSGHQGSVFLPAFGN